MRNESKSEEEVDYIIKAVKEYIEAAEACEVERLRLYHKNISAWGKLKRSLHLDKKIVTINDCYRDCAYDE